MTADEDRTRSVGDFDPRASPDRLWLMVLADDGAVGHPLPATGRVTIGRAGDCDIRIRDDSVSRAHAVLHIGGTLRIEDLARKNGIRVGHRKLAPYETADVHPGEPIQLGTVLLVVQQGSLYLAPDAGRGARDAARVLPALERGHGPRRWNDGSVVADDAAMQRVFKLVERVAPSTINVLLLGETGVGKEVLAAALHRASSRAERPFMPIHCAALAPSVLESELFGHERGAFTGAGQPKPGLLEMAEGGTVLLDEIGELAMDVQVKLLRVLEDKRVLRVGAVASRAIDVRFIAATNRDLKADVASGKFRKDLYYRLDGISIRIPPLRERPRDVEPLARAFAAGTELSREALRALTRYEWPGNVRELRNVIERAALLAGGGPIELEHLTDLGGDGETETAAPSTPPATREPEALRGAVETLERERIVEALEQCSGNQTRAAKLLGISRRMLISRLEGYRIPRPRKER